MNLPLITYHLPLDFIAIGDTVVDEFIKLKEAHVSCDENNENCTISMRWGEKIPYDFSMLVPAVGNSSNAAVAAARLGLSAGLVSNVGKDRYGEEILATLANEKVDVSHIQIHEKIPTDHYYILWYESERTILTQHEDFPFAWSGDIAAPKWIYLSSAGQHPDKLYAELISWLAEHPETKLAFQPGTLQINAGKEKLSSLYRASEVVACNKGEAQRILETSEEDMGKLLDALHELGPKIVLVTDGPKGAFVSDGSQKLKVPMYPDPKPPFERTGAGDAMTSTFVVALALGKAIKEALLWGPINSMSVVQHVGAQKGLLSREELESYIANAPKEYQVESF